MLFRDKSLDNLVVNLVGVASHGTLNFSHTPIYWFTREMQIVISTKEDPLASDNTAVEFGQQLTTAGDTPHNMHSCSHYYTHNLD